MKNPVFLCVSEFIPAKAVTPLRCACRQAGILCGTIVLLLLPPLFSNAQYIVIDRADPEITKLLSEGKFKEAGDKAGAAYTATKEPLTQITLKRALLKIDLIEAFVGVGDITMAEKEAKSLETYPWQKAQHKIRYLDNVGYMYLNKGRQDLALERLREALSLYAESDIDNSEEKARTLSYLSLTYNASGKYNQAEEYGLLALERNERLFGKNSEEVASAYNNLGLVYTQIDADKALEYYESALQVYTKLHGNDHPKIAVVSTNIGALYSQLELYGDAINNLEAASKVWLKIYPNGHPNVGFVYRSLGQTYVKMGNNALALTYFEKALTEYRKAFGEKNPDIASTLNQIGAVRLNMLAYAAALTDFQDALRANIPSYNNKDINSNPPVNQYYNANVLLYSLMLKAQGLEAKHFGKTLSLSDLKLALSSLQLCDSLIDDIRHHRTDESDKLSLGALASDVYEDGVRISSLISEMVGFRASPWVYYPKKYRELAFYFAEKSKSAVLQESIADAQAKSFAGIPQELVDQEKELKSGIAFLSQRLSQNPPAEEEKYLRESLFTMNTEYEAFTKKLEKDYPNYFNLKYNNAFPSVAQLQSMLKSNEAIVSYFIAEKGARLYQFAITSKSFKLMERSLPADFEKLAKGMNNSIYYRDFDTYVKTAVPLGKLLRPNLPGRINSITFIPSGRLSTMPLEALPSKQAGESFATTQYLVNKYAIGYEFSAGLIAQKQRSISKNSPSIFLCAPVTFPEKDNLNALPGSEAEVNAISNLFGKSSNVIKFKDANEGRVKSGDIANFNYLHFATHGVVDETEPELSRIYLNENASDDGHLFAGEIYNLSLNAELAVLSACQTGLGKYSKGEGVIGLSRALVYAGAKNLIVSFWSVADESTSMMMTDFYTVLLKNQEKGFKYALQQSKIDLIKSGKFAEPYYWAPFVLIGF